MKECVKCGNKIGFFSTSIKLKDGILCSKCARFLSEIGAGDVCEIGERISYEKLNSIIQHKQELNNKFVAEISIGEILEIDYSNKIVKFDNILYEFSNIANAEVEENWSQVTTTNSTTKKKGVLSRGIVGRLLFGGVGAVVGATTGKQVSNGKTVEKSVCDSVELMLSLNNYYVPIISLNLNPTYSELKKAQCSNVQIYAQTLKRLLNELPNKI